MANDSTFLDANVLLEIILQRPRAQVAIDYLEASTGPLAISALTGHLVVHFGSNVATQPVLQQFLADYTMLALDAAAFDWAFSNARSQDFEDALQIACAVFGNCRRFATFDRKLAKAYGPLTSIKFDLLT